jgi:uncharacterized DUF497 family protein
VLTDDTRGITIKRYYNLIVQAAGVEWDEGKNGINKRRHNIGFEQAQYIFTDPKRLERIDESDNNWSDEERWQTLGMVGKVLFVVYTERGEKKRIISRPCRGQRGEEDLQWLLSHRQ